MQREKKEAQQINSHEKEHIYEKKSIKSLSVRWNEAGE